MIDVVLKFSLISIFTVIFLQDFKERLVYWILYPLTGILAYAIQASKVGIPVSITNTVINLIFIFILLVVCFLYTSIKMKIKFINGSIGLGDILLFVFLCFTFSTVAFIVLLVFSLVFALLLHTIFKNKSNHTNVPLAGYISLFFASAYLLSMFFPPKYLFS